MRITPVLILIILCFAAKAQHASGFDQHLNDVLASLEAVRAVSSEDMIDTAGVIVESFRCPGSHERIACVAGIVDAPVDDVWKIITDFDNYGDLIPRCTCSQVVRREILNLVEGSNCPMSKLNVADYAQNDWKPEQSALLYSEIDIIFPVGRVHSILELTPDTTERVIHWRKIISDIPTYEGAWRLVPQGDKTMVVCVTQYRLNAWMPPFLIHSGVHFYFPKIITALRERVAGLP